MVYKVHLILRGRKGAINYDKNVPLKTYCTIVFLLEKQRVEMLLKESTEWEMYAGFFFMKNIFFEPSLLRV